MRLLAKILGCIVLIFTQLSELPGQAQGKQPQPEAFQYERPVIPGVKGPNRLLVDVPLLSRAAPFPASSHVRMAPGGETLILARGGLADLRIYDVSNREVPYLLVSPSVEEPQWSEGRILPVASTKQTSGFEVDLGRSLRIDRLGFAGLPAPFLKRVRLEGGGDRSRWTLLVPEGTLFNLPDENLKQLELEFAPDEFRYLRVTWDDRSSARMPLPSSTSARIVRDGAPPPPLRASLPFERRGSEPGKSRYRLRLPGAHLPLIALELGSTGENVLREARVTEAELSGNEVVPVVLGSATLRRAVRGELAAAELRIPIRSPSETQLDLTIEDGDNPPLQINGVTAIFAQLPWIYFESEGSDPLTARFGYPNLAAPRYDLEAARDSIPILRTSEARWGDLKERKPEAQQQSSSQLPGTGAPIARETFRFSRRILAGRPGLNLLQLDAAILAHSSLSDLRIAGQDGRQVPYLLEKLQEPLAIDLSPLERCDAPASYKREKSAAPATFSFYRIRFPYENLPPSRLVLRTQARVFQRAVSVVIEKNPYSERQEPWTNHVARADWSHTDPETPAPALTMDLLSLNAAEALLVVDEGDNNPLVLEPPKSLLPAYRIRFFREDEGELTLFYGKKNLEAPRYDLALLAPRLVGVAAAEISLGPENSTAQVEAMPFSNQLFWWILVAAVAALLALIVRLVKKGEDNAPASPQ